MKASKVQNFLFFLFLFFIRFGHTSGVDCQEILAFSSKLGISRQYLCDVEKGRRLVSPTQAARFAKAFGHPPRVLVQLALQDSVRESGLNLKVSVEDEAA